METKPIKIGGVHTYLTKTYGMKFCPIYDYSTGDDSKMPHIVRYKGSFHCLKYHLGCFYPFVHHIYNATILWRRDCPYFELYPTETLDKYLNLGYSAVKIINGRLEAV